MKQLLLFITCTLSFFSFSQGTQLLREPTIHDNTVVFTYANDLWQASTSGGYATRLTSDRGAESSPQYSRDGKFIAFTAEYDGNTDVYVIPATGGEPQRMTFHPSPDIVQGWTPDNKIMFRSSRESKPTESNRFFTIGLNDHFPEAMVLRRAAFGDISQDGKYMAYTPITSWDSEWRNYRGGQAMPIWIVDLATYELQTTSQPTKERHLNPVWHQGKVYFISERDYTSNIWSYDPMTKKEDQITFHKKFDVKNLDSDQSNIVYEQGGYLHLLNPSTKETNALNITINADYNFARARWESVSGSDLKNPALSPNGLRALFEHRGEIFSIPKDKGSWRNLSNNPGAADRNPTWSPKGDNIAWFSDANGEYQLIIADQYGMIQKTISLENPTFYFQPEWSPDGKKIAFTDTNYNIWIVDISSGNANIVGTDNYAHPNRSLNPVWSPDSKWIAYAKQQKSHFKAIFAYNIITEKTIQITDPLADAIDPVWDASGKYLYTLVSTDYGLSSGWLDMSSYDPSINRQLYAVVLSRKDKAPNIPESDEETKETLEDDKKAEQKKREKKGLDAPKDDKKEVVVSIDESGIYDRAVAMKLKPGNFIGLEKAEEHVVLVMEQQPDTEEMIVHLYDVKKQEAKVYVENALFIKSSYDGKHALLNSKSNWHINPTVAKAKLEEGKLDTNIKIYVDPQLEYTQIFKEGWRYMRDFLYVNNTHGAPWDKIYEWYSPWIKDVRHRSDLNYVVDIMSGEIAIGHSYVSGGDRPDIERVPVGLLGADLELKNNTYIIKKIYNGERWNEDLYAPLAVQGIDIAEGDALVAINGKILDGTKNPYQLLEQSASRSIYITVKSSSGKEKTVLVKPVSSESGLRTIDWIEGNRRLVDELSNGQLAYVYVPNTSERGFQSFNRYYFSQQDKKGVIIDERNNGGGSAADYMIDILKREPFGYFNSKANDNRPWTTPMAGIFGPKVMIINERAGSGGDLLPYMFKQQNIGPLVGTRTWGGLVGTWDTPAFIDGGRMVAPRGGFYDLDGQWAVEGEGVSPDIEVRQDPKATISGKDPQLERAIKEALRLLPNEEFKMKPEPPAPVRWKRPEGYDNDN